MPFNVRLPVLAGARIVFYLSCEQYHDDLPLPAHSDWGKERLQSELAVYRAQAQALYRLDSKTFPIPG